MFKPESSYKVSAVFVVSSPDGNDVNLKADLNTRFKTREEAQAFLESCKGQTFTISDISKKPLKKSPSAPFTTSTLQQEAARKLGFTVSQTMMVAQRLYESGRITYMRTDSVNLSSLCLNTSRDEIVKHLGEKYSKVRQFSTKSKGAQEAHEAIRPTYISEHEIDGTSQEKRLYELIWKRTIASQMADAETEKTTIKINISGQEHEFVATGEVVVFDGFLRVYRESFDEDASEQETDETLLPPVKVGQTLEFANIIATERYTQQPPRYNEASLVRKLEELGIGRPSTYAPTISTIQQRDYVERGDKVGAERNYVVLTLSAKTGKVSSKEVKEVVGSEKGKLIPTDIGVVVNDFLCQYFPEILDYNFTANVEKEFDDIAEGEEEWQEMLRVFYGKFAPMIERTLNDRAEYKVGERKLGVEPGTGKDVFVKIGRFGPMVQIGIPDETDKPKFAQLKKGQSIATITLEEALELFKLPFVAGEYEGAEVTVGSGRFGPYILHNGKFVSIPKGIDPFSVDLEQAISIIEEKRSSEQQKFIKKFEDAELEVLNGRYGPYINYKGANFRLPKTVADPKALTLEECMDIVKAQTAKPKRKKS